MQAQERVRKISSDLRHEVIDLGGAENIIELRMMNKKIKNKARASEGLMDVPVVRETHLSFLPLLLLCVFEHCI